MKTGYIIMFYFKRDSLEICDFFFLREVVFEGTVFLDFIRVLKMFSLPVLREYLYYTRRGTTTDTLADCA